MNGYTFSEQPTDRGGVGYLNKIPGVNDNGFFTFFRIIPETDAVAEESEHGHSIHRCDSSLPGPVGWHEWDDTKNLCNCGSSDKPFLLTRNHVASMHDLNFISVVIGPNGSNGLIIYIELSDPVVEENVVRDRHTVSARTLQELFRLLLEWEQAVDFFDCNELHALEAKNFISTIGLTDEVKAWLLEKVPPNKVERFLSNNEDARSRELPPNAEGTVFEPWVLDKIFKSIASIGDIYGSTIIPTR